MDIPEGFTLKSVKDIGDQVFCDMACGKEYTNSDAKGGFLFGSKAVCPECAKEAYSRIVGYGEEKFIKAWCPEDMSFREFVLKIRNGNNTIKTYGK